MCTCQTAKRRRRQAKMDKKYKPQFRPLSLDKPLNKNVKKASV